VHLFDGAQIGGIFEVVEKIFIYGTTLIGEQIKAIRAGSVVHKTRMDSHTESVLCK
jgi:hypothetical protein